MTIFVSGATGNVGRPLVEELLAAGHQVRALTRNPAKANLPAGVEVVAGNLDNTDSLAEVFTGVTAAHLISFGDNYVPLFNGAEIMALVKQAGVRKVTVLRGDVEPSALDAAVAAAGLDHAYLGPVEFMSNTLEWAESITKDGLVREGFSGVKSAVVHDADIASVAAAVLTSDGHTGKEYWLTGPEALTPPEKVRIIAEVLGREIGYVDLTEAEVIEQWRAQGYSAEDIGFFLGMRQNPPELGATVAPTVEQVTGKPGRTFAQWVRENAAAFGG
ncbi:NmrA family NAD(P)-binding protein [Crossiella cryophila]|uniref:Uncharacterized protein YbjT (DUF2867 family) n=1 Tax=Crossiella cryophila TaxID=43355 RepID=A0A7W7CAJ2_9PSEU|nr:NAD(P)H-binding protein [Crossiella cryophila]MBB4676144.1 uncharacterized protein YbjT (DUF2867 family) [Crossiella cryophila]